MLSAGIAPAVLALPATAPAAGAWIEILYDPADPSSFEFVLAPQVR